MTDFRILSNVKYRLIEALTTLPTETILLTGENNSELAEFTIGETVEEDIEKLESFWEFIDDYRNTKVIALVGMVNVGKSALGNLLLHRGESDVFEEACTRETSKAQQAQIDDETLIIDLPGLGSVLCEEDDAIVKEIIRRANVILVVLDVSYPITKHLYNFIKSDDVLKNGILQRIVIVINKIDCLSDLPERLRQKQIQNYIKFLQSGNPKMNFEGIASLFDYEIPIVPFSVAEARSEFGNNQEGKLRQVINESLKLNSNSAVNRAEVELVKIADKYLIVVLTYVTLREKQQNLDNQIESSIQKVLERISESFSRELDTLSERIQNIRASCIRELGNYTTTSAERFWQGDNFQWKKKKCSTCRERHQEQMISEFQSFVSNLRSNILIITRSFFGSIQIIVPNGDSITSALQSSIYEIWDAFDDYWFLDKERYTFDRSIEESDQYWTQARNDIASWVIQFEQNLLDTLRSQIQNTDIFQEWMFCKDNADPLQEFTDFFVAIDYFKHVL